MNIDKNNFGTITELHPIVNVKNGKVRGESREGIGIFRGIPYGDRVDGNNRFLPPKPARNWNGVRDCTKNGPICPQLAGSVQTWDDQGPAFHGGHLEYFKVENEEKNENCLILNVLTPGLDYKKRPVLFYIHGGGYSSGSGVLILGAHKLCSEEDIVLVSVNHRIGPFGYLYLGEYDEKYKLSGIVGLLDIVLALHWVQENIEKFGGDPEQVTILGESGGGSKVASLLSMDITEGLFRNAVIESGSTSTIYHNKESGNKIAKKSLEFLGIKENELEKLKNLTQDDIFNLTNQFSVFEKSYVPVPDGEIMPLWDDGEYHLAKWAKDVPIMLGASEEESAILESGSKFDFNKEELRRALLAEPDSKTIVPIERPLCNKYNIQKVMDYLMRTKRKTDTYSQLYYKVLAQPQFCIPTIEEAIGYKNQGSKKIYAYLVTYDSHHPEFPEYKFSWHTATLPLQMRIVLHKEDESLSRKLSHILATFVKKGIPDTEEIQWNPFTAEERQMLVIDEECMVQKDPQKELRELLLEEIKKDKL